MQRRSLNGTLVALSTRIPADLMTQLEALTPATGSMAATVRSLLDQAVNRDAVVMQFVADALEQAAASQRRHFSQVLRVVLLNVCHAAEEDVRAAIQKLEENGLL